MDWKYDYLQQFFEQVEPLDFYRGIFPKGELQQKGVYSDGKCNGIAVELAERIKRYTITDDLETIDELLHSANFCIVSPISYIGKSRESGNARYMYALAIDLDGINQKTNIVDLLHQIEKVDYLPRPTYIVVSGVGLHLYYVFQEPIPLYRNIVMQLTSLKNDLTRKIWNGYVTDLKDKVQYQSIFQGFRLVGGVTKSGNRTAAFRTGEKITVEYLNGYVLDPKNKVREVNYNNKISLDEARQKYPEWYQKRIVEKNPKGTWTVKRDLYDWWKRRMYEIQEGHRYYYVMCLAVYAKKCGIARKELESDAFGMVERLDRLTSNEDNHFTRADVLAALELYNDNYMTFPVDTISQLTDLKIEKNKRNGRKQEVHLMGARAIQEINDRVNGTNWRDRNGRPDKANIVQLWQQEHPNGRKADCIRDTGLSKPTVYKWWK